ncbi:MAG: hypothetical protein ABSD89_04990 [Halobacteriota archaeon]
MGHVHVSGSAKSIPVKGATLLVVAAPFAGVIVKRRGAKLPIFIATALLAASVYCLYAFQ